MCCVNMRAYGNRERVCECDHRDRDGERERGERKWDRQQRYELPPLLSCSILPSSSSSSSLLPLRGSEGGHPFLQALNQPAGDLARPGYGARSLCLTACYAAILLPSHRSRCQVTPPRAQRCRSTRCPLFCPRCAKIRWQTDYVLRQCIALREVFDRDHDKTCPG